MRKLPPKNERGSNVISMHDRMKKDRQKEALKSQEKNITAGPLTEDEVSSLNGVRCRKCNSLFVDLKTILKLLPTVHPKNSVGHAQYVPIKVLVCGECNEILPNAEDFIINAHANDKPSESELPDSKEESPEEA